MGGSKKGFMKLAFRIVEVFTTLLAAVGFAGLLGSAIAWDIESAAISGTVFAFFAFATVLLVRLEK